jgi:DNA polymerase V
MNYYALLDCNNFFVSCERIFNPKLVNKPVVILSNNDGCVVARSNEAKKLNIPMGAPFFKYESYFFLHQVHVLSGNHALYADISRRVFLTLEEFSYPIEIYSVDEAFIQISGSMDSLVEIGKAIKEKIYQWVGIPVSIGFAKTKTLSKIASELAKKNSSSNGVYVLEETTFLFKSLFIQDVWGIGKKYKEKLNSYGIITIFDFIKKDPNWIKKAFNILLVRTQLELQGIPCIEIPNHEDYPKSMVHSRSLKKDYEDQKEIYSLLISFLSKLSTKLRSKKLETEGVGLFLYGNRFKDRSSFHAYRQLDFSTNTTSVLIQFFKPLFEKFKNDPFPVKRVGIYFFDLKLATEKQLCLLKIPDEKKDLMKTIDAINKKFPQSKLRYGSEAVDPYKMLSKKNSSSLYTTSFQELLTIRI